MDDWLLEIAVPGFEPVERRIDRALLSIGSDRGADVRITSLSERWAIVRRVDAGLELRRIGVAGARVVPIGGALEVDGVELRLRDASAPEVVDDGLPLEALAEALAEADQPADALAALVEGLIAATRAQTGAIVLRDETGYRIPIARRADGRPLEGAEALLSDTVVSDVLDGAEKIVCVSDLGQSERYATVPSVVSLSLSSVLCVPMRMGARVLGAVYLGHHDPRHRFSDTHARDLGLLATMALPLLEQLRRRALEPAAATERLVGESEPMVRVRELVRRVAPSDLSVLVLGETGTGKEVAARAIHEASPRAELPMIALNCAAVPESLLAVELFGCKKGAYTGAVSDRKGRIEAADGSTLFLDEVGDMPLSMQVALLRVLEEKAVTRVGENEERPVDFRLVAATSVDLDAAVEAGRFRKDLLYRLRELAVHLPPLRDRGEDLLLLASLFLQQCARSLGIGGHELSAASRRAILAHRWEGNVRELRAVMRRASILCDGRTIEPEHLQLDSKAAVEGESLGPLDLPLVEARDRFVTRYVATVLDRHDGNREAAAAALDISVRSLYRYLA